MRRTWIKLYTDQVLRGTMFTELEDPAERFVWIGFLLLAGDSAFDGRISITENLGYTDDQIAGLLKLDDVSLIRKSKRKMVKFDKIRVGDNNVIEIVNWAKYQSEYGRQKKYRDRPETYESYYQGLPAEVTLASYNLDIDIDIERDKNRGIDIDLLYRQSTIKDKIKKEKLRETFEGLWSAWPSVMRKNKVDAFKAFFALSKKVYLKIISLAYNGYIDYLIYQRDYKNFDQRPMYPATFLRSDRWAEFVDFKTPGPRL